MRNYIYKILCVFLFVFTNVYLQAQIVINSSDLPSINDTIRISKALPIAGMNLDSNGANVTWDFSLLTPQKNELDTFLSVASTSFVYYAVFFNASLAGRLPSFSIPIPSQTLNFSEGYTFYKKNNSVFSQLGFGSELNGVPIPVKYSSEDVQYKFPLEYGDKDSCTFKYNVQIPNLGYFEETKKRKNTVDAWGTLTTPYGTFEVLRVVSQLQIKDSIFYDAYSFGIAINRTETEYKWLGKSKDIPILKIVKNNFAVSEITYIDSARVFTNIENVSFDENIVLYPNPVKTNVIIHAKNCNIGKVIVYDVLGNTLLTKETDVNEIENINVEVLQNGIYFVNIYNKDLSLIGSRKMLINK